MTHMQTGGWGMGPHYRLASYLKRVPMPTDWHWLDPHTPADLDSDFMEAVAGRVEDKEHPPLWTLFD